MLFVIVGVAAMAGVALARAYPVAFICLTGYSLVLGQSFPVAYIDERPLNLSADYILIPLLIGAWLTSGKQRAWPSALPGFTRAYSCFSAWALLSLCISVYRHGIVANLAATVEALKWFLYTLLFLPCWSFVNRERQARTVLRHLAMAATAVIIAAYVQWWILPNRSAGNIVGTFSSVARQDIISGKSTFATYAAMVTLVILAHFLFGCLGRWRGLWGLVASSIIVIWSFSRSAMLGMAVGTLWLIVSAWRTRAGVRLDRGRVEVVLMTLGSVGLIALVMSAIESFAGRTPFGAVASLFGDPSRSHGAASAFVRIELIGEGMRALSAHVVSGYGWFARAIERPELGIVDNFFLDVALDTGIIGLGFMLWLLGSMLLFSEKLARRAIGGNATELGAWSWGVGGALACLYFAGISASIPYAGRILGTVVIGLACLGRWDSATHRVGRVLAIAGGDERRRRCSGGSVKDGG